MCWVTLTSPLLAHAVQIFMEGLSLHYNRLSGSLAQFVGALVEVTRDDILNGQQTHFWNLRNLDLSRNTLSGSLPETLSSVSTLEWVDFSQNRLIGAIPECYSKLKNLRLLDLHSNRLTGPWLKARTMFKLQSLNLSHNQLGGRLPVDDSLGRLTSLLILNISHNKFTGTTSTVEYLRMQCVTGRTQVTGLLI